jgi:hypothetical protein
MIYLLNLASWSENRFELGFTDDITTIQIESELLLKNINIIENWCVRNKMKLNKDNCGI